MRARHLGNLVGGNLGRDKTSETSDDLTRCCVAMRLDSDALQQAGFLLDVDSKTLPQACSLSFPESMARVLPLKHWHSYIS